MKNYIFESILANISCKNVDLIEAQNMPQNLVDLWQKNLNALNNLLIEDLSKTESPIEKMFLMEFNLIKLIKPDKLPPESYFELIPQAQIVKGSHKYRVDFKIDVDLLDRVGMPESPTETIIFIELDGHDFHEKTKQQATNDKIRERALSDKCDALLRYTGSEVYQNPYQIVSDVLKHVADKYSEKLKVFEN